MLSQSIKTLSILISAALLNFSQFAFAEQFAEDELLPPEVAFKATVKVLDNQNLQVTYNIADKYYLYNSKFQFRSNTDGVTLGDADIPKGKKKVDPFFGEVQTHRQSIKIKLPFKNSNQSKTLELIATSQGCADIGVCYPPYTHTLLVELPKLSVVADVTEQAANALQTAGNALKSFGLNFGLEEQNEVLHPDKAFKASVIENKGEIFVRMDIVDQHYLYQDKFKFELINADGFSLGEAKYSPSEEKDDPFFGIIQVYYNSADITVPVIGGTAVTQNAQIRVTYQGCSESSGICYPPQKKVFDITLTPSSTSAPITNASSVNTPPASSTSSSSAPVTEQDKIAASFFSNSIYLTLLTFFGLGLLLTFTPCVLPMIPILSSIIVGSGEKISTKRAFSLSLAYVLAMAFTYTTAGVIVGLLGINVQVWFQDPIVLSVFAALFVLLSLSMFGFYELQMPASIQAKLTGVSNNQKAGSLKGAAIMGLLSALIVGPCVTAPLVGALIYIAETGDAVFGGLALFSLSMGMGTPLLIVGTSAGKLLPKVGAWMDATKAVFGVMLLAMALWMLERILPVQTIMVLTAILLIGSGVYSGAFEAIGKKSGWSKLWKTIGIVMVLYGTLLMIGALSGGNSFFAPLKGTFGSGGGQQSTQLVFEPVKSIEDLNKALKQAKAENRNVMLDFYADWCISCKEMEAYTFSDARVKQALGNAVLLKADVTKNDDHDQALLKHFGLFGPPGIIFYKAGTTIEEKNYRVVGFMEANKFTTNINNAFK